MQRQWLINWLRDLHEMETQLLLAHSRDASDPRQSVEVRVRLEAHLRETERHVERVSDALRAVGAAPRTSARAHTLAAATRGARVASDPIVSLFSDPVVSKALLDFAAEQCAVAAYTALIAAAEHAGETEVARLGRFNRGEDEEMAEWLNARIEILTEESVKRL